MAKSFMITIYNLATGAEMTFANMSPREALISGAIVDANETDNLTNPITREKFNKRIIVGKRSASLDDMAVDLKHRNLD